MFPTPWSPSRSAGALRGHDRVLFLVRTKRVYRQRQTQEYLLRLLDVYLPHAGRVEHLTHGTVLYQGGSWVVYLLR